MSAAPRPLVAVLAVAAALTRLASLDATPAAERTALDGRPTAIVDLDSSGGLRAIRGEWRYAESPAGGPVQAAGAVGFDDSSWPIVPGGALQQRRTNGGASLLA